MINVQGLRRNVKNVVRNYTYAQVKVREATSNDPWGPSSTLMSEIADLTYNVVAFVEIMQVIWKRLNDHGKNWRHVYKALVLLEYLIKTGSEKVAQQCRENIFVIQTLKDFQYTEDNKDQGLNVREKAKQLVTLLSDEERLKNERARALKTRERFAQSTSHARSDSITEGLASDSGFSSGNAISRPEMENARPQTAGEEELQLQLALAMSKEEADKEDRLRKNDDLRLQMALTESQEDFKRLKSNSLKPRMDNNALEDLMGLSFDPSALANRTPLLDPWGMPISPPLQMDPWSSPVSNHTSPIGATGGPNDLWDPSEPVPPPPPQRGLASATNGTWPGASAGSTDSIQDPWVPQGSTAPPTHQDDFDLLVKRSNNTGAASGDPTSDLFNLAPVKNSLPLGSIINNLGPGVNNSSNSKTPESFLGENSNLVNLDALVSSHSTKSNGLISADLTNPFAAVTTPPTQAAAAPTPASNPFQAIKAAPPTINQLRANQFGNFGAVSSENATSFYHHNPTTPSNNNSSSANNHQPGGPNPFV